MATPNSPTEKPEQPQGGDILERMRREQDVQKQKDMLRAELEAGRVAGEKMAALRAAIEAKQNLPKSLEEKEFSEEILARTEVTPESPAEGKKETEKKPDATKSENKEKKEETMWKKTGQWLVDHPVATLGLIAGGIWLARRIKRSYARGQEAAKQKDGTWFDKLLAGVAIGAAAFTGLDIYMKGALTKKVKDGIEKGTEEVKGMYEKATGAAESKKEELAGNEGVELLKHAEKNEREKMIISGVLVANADEVRKAGIDTWTPSEQESVFNVALRQDVAEIPLSELKKVNAPEAIDGLNLFKEPYTEKEKRALYFLALVCAKHQERIQQERKRRNESDDLSGLYIGDVIKHIAPFATAFGRLTEELRTKDITDLTPEDVAEKIIPTDGVEDEWGENAGLWQKLVEKEPRLEGKQLEFLAFCEIYRTQPIKNFNNLKDAHSMEEADVYIAGLRALREEVTSEKVRVYLRQYTHGREEYAQALDQYLSEDLSIADALQLQMFLERGQNAQGELPASIKDAEGMTAFLLQLKVMGMLTKGNKETGIGFGAFLALDGLQNVQLPPETIKLLKESAALAKDLTYDKIKNGFSHAAVRFSKWYAEAMRAHPVITTGSTIVVPGTAAALFYRRQLRLHRIRKLARMSGRPTIFGSGDAGINYIQRIYGIKDMARAQQIRTEAGHALGYLGKRGKIFTFILESGDVKKVFDRIDKIRNGIQVPPLEEELKAMGLSDDAIATVTKETKVVQTGTDAFDDYLKANQEAAKKLSDEALDAVQKNPKLAEAAAKSADDPARVVERLNRTAKVMRACAVLGIFADVVVVFTSIGEMMETTELLKDESLSKELREAIEGRYKYQAINIGVATVGAGTGALALAGVGTTVTGPVALATLPIMAGVAWAYEGQALTEEIAKTTEDWKKMETTDIIIDLRNEDWGESFGKAWHIVSSLGSLEVKNDIRTMNQKMLRAIVEQTTSVTIPETMRDETGKERALTPDEEIYYKGALRVYWDAKMTYINALCGGNEDTPLSGGLMLNNILRESESYARMRHDEFALAHQWEAEHPGETWNAETQLPADWPKAEQGDKPEIAMLAAAIRYEKYAQREFARMLLMRGAHTLAESEGNAADYETFVRERMSEFLMKDVERRMIDVQVQSKEETDWSQPHYEGVDNGSIPLIVSMYMAREFEALADSHSTSTAKEISAIARQAFTSPEKTADGVALVNDKLDAALTSIAVLHKSPKEIWKNMSEEDERYFLNHIQGRSDVERSGEADAETSKRAKESGIRAVETCLRQNKWVYRLNSDGKERTGECRLFIGSGNQVIIDLKFNDVSGKWMWKGMWQGDYTSDFKNGTMDFGFELMGVLMKSLDQINKGQPADEILKQTEA